MRGAATRWAMFAGVVAVPISVAVWSTLFGNAAATNTAITTAAVAAGDITVSSSGELNRALAASRGGTISLLPGRYTQVIVNGLKPARQVVITSANPALRAEIGSLLIRNSANIVVDGLAFAALDSGRRFALDVEGSNNVALRNLAFQNTVKDAGANGELAPVSAIFLRNSKQLSVTGSRFADYWNGVSHLAVTGLVVADNVFWSLRTDGVRGGGSSDVTITRNIFYNFHPAPGDHPDAVQFWIRPENGPSSNISVTRNLIVGGGEATIQGIFMRSLDGRIFSNVTISGNLLVGTLFNGIALSSGRNVSIENNFVLQAPPAKSWIRVQDVASLSLSGNMATTFLLDGRAQPGVSGFRVFDGSARVRQQAIADWRAKNSDWLAAGSEQARLADAALK
ncbi:MAG: right-handed parallel beta-helix repeat-containing protein [Sphingomonas sp.]